VGESWRFWRHWPLEHGLLLGIGEVRVARRGAGRRQKVCALAGLDVLKLRAKEGLALINGTQVSTALALAGLFGAERCVRRRRPSPVHMSVDALKGSDSPFDERNTGSPGPTRANRRCARIPRPDCRQRHSRLGTSDCTSRSRIRTPSACSAAGDGRLSGSDSQLQRHPLKLEATPSPTTRCCSSTRGDVLSGGNFHAEPVAFAADTLGARDSGNRQPVGAPDRRVGRSQNERPARLLGGKTAASIPAS